MAATRTVTLVLLALFMAAPLWAEDADDDERYLTEDDETILAMQTQNPVADLISLPVQNNFNFGVGPKNVTQYVGNLQPVIPFHLAEEWNLITRTILPIINQPSPAPGIPSEFGLSDLNMSLFFSPRKPGAIIWGVGPILTFPTATDSALGSGKWSMGPAGVVLTMQGPWVFGALVNQQWSVAGDSDRRSVSQMLIQPFVNYNLPHGWVLTTSPTITANWMADSGNQWTVPLGGGFGKLWRIGAVGLPVNTSLQAYYNVAKPQGAADWSIRFTVQFILPK